MAKLSLWYHNARRSDDFKFIDKTISEYFWISGTCIYIHLYKGVGNTSTTTTAGSSTAASALGAGVLDQLTLGTGGATDGSVSTTTTTTTISQEIASWENDEGLYAPVTIPDPVTGMYPETPWLTSTLAINQTTTASTSAGGTGTSSSTSGSVGNASLTGQVQDVLFLENRNRAYDSNVYEMRMCYTLGDADFDLTQFGLSNMQDIKYGEIHINDMVALCGRKIMAGDVLELPHMRDDMTLDAATPAINKFYVVQDAYRAAEGYGATWHPHIWRLKLSPMPATAEYSDILNAAQTDPFGLKTDKTLADAISTLATDLQLNEDIVRMAEEKVKKKNFETRQYYMVPGSELAGEYPWVWAGDGIPPNGAALVGSGTVFPISPQDGDFYLRTDYIPHTLFKRDHGIWQFQELDYRLERWDAAHRVLLSFVNDRKTSTFKDGTTAPERQPLWRAIKPKADL
jgi:hypothetical protein